MPRRTGPASLMGNYMQMSMMMIEAQQVIAMRLMGMAGVWSVSPQENTRMVTEKMAAMTKSANAAGQATLQGGSPNQITAAAIAPIRRATRANSRRLGKNGLKTP
jgi:hypothetical protein